MKKVVVGVILCALGITVVLFLSPFGLGISPDSVSYLQLAENLLAGTGFSLHSKSIAHFPPGYPLLLASASLFTAGDLQLAARVLAGVVLGANLFLLGLLSSKRDSQALLFAFLAAIFAFCSESFLMAHLMAWSESVFLLFTTAGIWLLGRWLTESHGFKNKSYALLSAAICLGLATLIRYAGISFILSGALTLFFFNKENWRNKLRVLIVFLSTSLAPLLIWIVRNMILSGSATNRELTFNPVTFEHFSLFMTYWSQFLSPAMLSQEVTLQRVSLLILIALGYVVFRHRHFEGRMQTQQRNLQLSQIFLFSGLSYLAFLAFSISFVDAHTPIDNRTLLPFFYCVLVALVLLPIRVPAKRKVDYAVLTLLLLALCTLPARFTEASKTASFFKENGVGFNSREWKESETLAQLKDCCGNYTIYSNGADIISFLSELDAKSLPAKYSPGTKRKNEQFISKVHTILDEISDEKSVIVYLKRITWRPYLPSSAEFSELPFLEIKNQYSDGIVFWKRQNEEKK